MLPNIKFLAIMTCFLLTMTGCTKTTVQHAGELNAKASFPADFKFPDKGMHVITSSVNKRENTTSVLYGNAAAQKFAGGEAPADSTGVVMTLVTWNEEDDERWFGARIPGDLLCVETVTVTGTAAKPQKNFELYSGVSLKKEADVEALQAAPRIKYILQQKASIMP